MSEIKTYRFSTFQEFFDRVPADRMVACLGELGALLTKSRQTIDLLDRSQRVLAEGQGVQLPDGPTVSLVLPELEWIDDGKGDIEMHFRDGLDGSELMGMSLAPDGTPTFTVPAPKTPNADEPKPAQTGPQEMQP